MRRRVVLVVAIVLVLAVPLAVLRLATLPPRWWSPPEASSPQVQALASRAESAVMTEATHVREGPAPWTLRLAEEQANAWLAARLPEWISHERGWSWPQDVAPPQVHIADGLVRVAFQVPGAGRSRFVEARLAPRIADGRLHVRLERASIGRLPFPGEPLEYAQSVLVEAGSYLGVDLDTLARAVAILAGRRSVEPSFRLGDGRTVRVLDLRCTEGVLELECVTTGP